MCFCLQITLLSNEFNKNMQTLFCSDKWFKLKSEK